MASGPQLTVLANGNHQNWKGFFSLPSRGYVVGVMRWGPEIALEVEHLIMPGLVKSHHMLQQVPK
jgi:hypothetical protein